MVFQMGKFDAERRVESSRISQGNVLALWHFDLGDFLQSQIECFVNGCRGLDRVCLTAGYHCVILLQLPQLSR